MRKDRVGLIVAGCLVFGLVVALALVIVPFGGAQEHVILGVAFLAFALGWALVAVATTRWTDHLSAGPRFRPLCWELPGQPF